MNPKNVFMSVVEFIDNLRFVRVFPYMSLMVYCASLFVCESVRKRHKIHNMTWIQSLFMCFIGQFGGTALASITIGQPIRFLTSDKLVVALIMAWLTIFCSPFDIGLKIFQIRLIRIICFFFQLLSISFSITAYGVDYVFKSDHPKAMVGLSMLVVTGTISGCGGGVLLRYLNLIYDDTLEKPTHKLPEDLIRPTFPVKRAFFSTLLYIFFMDPLGFIRGNSLFDPKVCHILTFLFVAFTTVIEKMGWNVFDSVSSIFHDFTQIPKEIPVFARRWSFNELYEKEKEN